MNDRQINENIRQAFSAAAPDRLDDILRRCDTQKGAIVMMPRKKANRMLRRLAAVAAAAALALCGMVYTQTQAVASTVSLDVNPSIQIDVNSRQRVLAVVPLNEDGKTVVGDMNFRGSDLEVTVNALIGSMLRSGYLSEIANSILVSVKDNDTVRAEKLQQQLSAEIDALLETGGLSAAVLSQTVSADDTLTELAASNNITTGKAQFIRQMVSQNAFYSEEELARLSINDLYLLNTAVDNVSATGQASEKAYIGKEAALQAALTHANAPLPSRHKTELDYEDGRMVYEIEFFANNGEYDYEIDARTGEVRKWNFEPAPKVQDAQPTPAAPETSGRLTPEEAFMKALVHAGLAQYSVDFGMEWELDEDHGVTVYELEFQYNGTEYEYEIDAATGAVLKYEKEKDD